MFDVNNDQELVFAEFLLAIASKVQWNLEKRLKLAFHMLVA